MPVLLFVRHEHGADAAFAGWLMPIVPPMVSSAVGIGRILDEYPGSSYLRTDQACSSLSQSSQGQPIYVVFFGPYPMASDACAARADGTSDAYAKQLLDSGGVTGAVDCSA